VLFRSLAALTSGLALAAFAYLAFFPLALVLMFAVGGGVILAAAAVNTILQTIVPDRLRGRIAGFFTLAFLGVAPLGNLAAGALADAVGVRATFALNGLIAMAAALWLWRALPALRELMRPTYLRLGIIAEER
jgi:MFS family permease